MISFKDMLTESKAGKNLHLEHLEDEILNFGVDGGRAALNFLRSLRDMLSGDARSSVNMTVKWDGAPAIFAGIDPADGKFFIGKKSVFNKTGAKLYKSQDDLDNDNLGSGPDSIYAKFSIALAELSKLGIKGVLQGDLMFVKDMIETETIDGLSYYTFQPNTIVYAVEKNSELGRMINKAEIGIVWHTTYTGNSFEDMKAKFGTPIVPKLRKSNKVWMDDATYRDVSGTATFTAAESKKVIRYV